MFIRIAQQAAAFSLAAIATLSILATVQTLATQPGAQPAQLAASTSPTQVVVITGQRIARS